MKTLEKVYLIELQEAHGYHCGHLNPPPVAVDDVVIAHAKDQPRGFWKLGHVKDVLVGRDGVIRGLQLVWQARGAKQPC